MGSREEEEGPGPTRHLPRTEGKIRVMTLRESLGLPLFHPLDARCDDKPPKSKRKVDDGEGEDEYG